MAKNALNKSYEYERYYQELGNNRDTKVFDSMKDVFMFAATLGYKKNIRVPFSKSGGEPISLRFFRDDDENIMSLIALLTTEDIGILLKEDNSINMKYKIIEEYANGGMRLMVDEFCKPVVDFAALCKFIESFDNSKDNIPKADIGELLEKAMTDL